MNTFTGEVRDNAMAVPPEIIAQLGWQEETRIFFKRDNGSILLRPQELTAEEIDDLACTYLVKYVGDATAVKDPIFVDGKWRVEVVLSYRDETVGFLTFSRDGQLIPQESDSPQKMKSKYR